MKRKSRQMPPDRSNSGDQDDSQVPAQGGKGGGQGGGKSRKGFKGSGLNLAMLGSIFMVGVVMGVILTYSINLGGKTIPGDLDLATLAPNPELCAKYGASAMVTETRTFVTLSPPRVFVSQPQTLPGCVLRSSNWNVLKQKDVITSDDISACRNRTQTFAYTGDIEVQDQSEVDCVSQNDGQRRF